MGIVVWTTSSKRARNYSSVLYAMFTGQLAWSAFFFSPCHYLTTLTSFGSPTACGDCSIWFAITERDGMNCFYRSWITALSAAHLTIAERDLA